MLNEFSRGFVDIVIDFDGTCIPEGVFPNFAPPFPGLISALEKLRKNGFRIVLSTCRTASYWKYIGSADYPTAEEQALSLREWISEYKVPIDEVYLHDKPLACFYVDDRAVRFSGDWLNVVAEIERRVQK